MAFSNTLKELIQEKYNPVVEVKVYCYDGVDEFELTGLKNKPNITLSTGDFFEDRITIANSVTLRFENYDDRYFYDDGTSSIWYENSKWFGLSSQIRIELTIEGETENIWYGSITNIDYNDNYCIVKAKDKLSKILNNKMKVYREEDYAGETPPDDLEKLQFTDKPVGWLMWALLTGYDYDTGLILNTAGESWYNVSAQLDNTQTSANVDIDYEIFETSYNRTDDILMSGRFEKDDDLIKTINTELVKFSRGRIYVDGTTSKFVWFVWQPEPPFIAADFERIKTEKDDIINLKKSMFSYDIDNITNQILIKFKYDYTNERYDEGNLYNNVESVNDVGIQEKDIESPFLQNETIVNDIVSNILERYKSVNKRSIKNFKVDTDLSALFLKPGMFAIITDENNNIVEGLFEVMKVKINLETRNATVELSDAAMYQLIDDEKWSFFWGTNTDGFGHGGDGAVEYTLNDIENNLNGAIFFAKFSGDLPAENLGYIFF